MAVTHSFKKPTGTNTSVEVTFTNDDPAFTHVRSVNAVFDSNGKYDKAATTERVNQVALGVENKIAIGAITPPAEDSE
jgi:hypothetical protein